ncbi:MAG TPA: rRNA maturation RNase YbeY [Candidatus Limnocylindria bacterium]|nr:rRNA maturation RNase YbeY [Candidatus Limnocylindria bacterium]
MADRHARIYLPPWRIDITRRPAVQLPLPLAELARRAAAALSAAHAPPTASLGLILSGDRELALLNEQHMAEPGPTDVLSFPLLAPAAYPAHAGQDAAVHARPAPLAVERGFALPPRQRLHLGDVVISVERAAAQARAARGGQTGSVRWSAADELRLLVVHGTLHVCGWDHARQAEAAAMRELEQMLLRAPPGRSA